MNREQIDAGFDHARSERFLRANWIKASDPGFWRRDRIGPEARVIAHEVPAIINVWIPLTDVSPIDSCMDAIPAPGDPDYYSAERRIRPEAVRLQDVRALPAPAGSVLGWSTHLAHWGSRSRRFATGPRVSVTVHLQRRDSPVVHPATVELDAPMPFRARLEWIWSSLGIADVEERGSHE